MTAFAAAAALPASAARPPRAASIALAGRREIAFRRARLRLTLGAMVFVALILVLAARLVELAVVHGPAHRAAAAPAAQRGDIVDRNGRVLAHSFDALAIVVAPARLVPRLASNPQALAGRLAAILPGRDAATLQADLSNRRTFQYISRRVLPEQAQRINDLGEPAISLAREPARLSPNLSLGAHVLGYTVDAGGKYGVERTRDGALERPGGAPVQLAMDSRVQQALEAELFAGMTTHRALGAAGLVLDVATGEIVAMASLPSFNPNAAGHSDDNARFNRTTQGVYELGSTFKTLTIAMALDAGTITSMAQTYDATHNLKVGRFTIHDDHPIRKWLTVPEIFIHSSNIGTARMAAQLGAARQRAYLDSLGFLAPVQVELVERGKTLYPPISNWGEIATMTVGYGHGMAVTPLHLATAYAAVVNGGIWRPATLFKVAPGHAVPGRRVFSEATSDKMRALLRLVVTSGTGRKANTPGYRVGGKTGTAEKPKGGRYAKHALVSTFAAAFPMDAPRYVVIAMLDEPHGTAATGGFATAGMVAAPIVERIVARIGPVLGVRPDLERDIDLAGLLGTGNYAEAKE